MIFNFITLKSILKMILGLLLVSALMGAKGGCGTKETKETLASPVQAVISVFKLANGVTIAQAVLISTATTTHKYIDTAKNVILRVPGGEEVELNFESNGHYSTNSSENVKLEYKAGETYRLTFDLDDDDLTLQVSGGSFIAVMDAPDSEVSFSFSKAPEFAGSTSILKWEPNSSYGLIKVVNDDTNLQTYNTFDFDKPQFDGDKWARLTKNGTKSLSVDVFPDAGKYSVSFCGLSFVRDFDVSLSADLGVLSGFLMGQCAEDLEIEVE